MKTLGLTLAITFIAASTIVASNAAGAPLSPRAAANAPSPVSSAGAAASIASQPVLGSPRGLATFPGSASPNAITDVKGACKTANKNQCHMPCCG
jgi:hypothetical protein